MLENIFEGAVQHRFRFPNKARNEKYYNNVPCPSLRQTQDVLVAPIPANLGKESKETKDRHRRATNGPSPSKSKQNNGKAH